MVGALKDYNKTQYTKKYTNSMLDVLIGKFTKEVKQDYSMSAENKSFVDKSVQNLAINSIIEGYFPKENLIKAMAVKRVNRMLVVILGLLIAVVITSYYFVITCEMKLNELSRQTVVLNNENEELQNRLDSLKSFSNVDQTLQKNNMMQRAGQVIETPEITIDTENTPHQTTSKKRFFNCAIGF